ncbi:hypothetical protein OROHE_013261 [Orobanche hederae]
MASSTTMSLILFIATSVFIQGTLAEVICENLPTDLCSFAIASSGKRCVLENYYLHEQGSPDFTCKTSEVVVEGLSGHIETDDCVRSCGVDRRLVGISSDALLSPEFTARLCSPACYHNCPNLVDLHFNLAAGEGVYLPALCKKQNANPRRSMLLMSSGGVAAEAPAAGPVASAEFSAIAPAAAPATL